MRIRVLIADDHAMVAEGLEHVVAAQSDFTVVGTAQDNKLPDQGEAKILRISLPRRP